MGENHTKQVDFYFTDETFRQLRDMTLTRYLERTLSKAYGKEVYMADDYEILGVEVDYDDFGGDEDEELIEAVYRLRYREVEPKDSNDLQIGTEESIAGILFNDERCQRLDKEDCVELFGEILKDVASKLSVAEFEQLKLSYGFNQ